MELKFVPVIVTLAPGTADFGAKELMTGMFVGNATTVSTALELATEPYRLVTTTEYMPVLTG